MSLAITYRRVANPTLEDKVDQSNGKAALVTGANVGLGKEVARQLAASGRY